MYKTVEDVLERLEEKKTTLATITRLQYKCITDNNEDRYIMFERAKFRFKKEATKDDKERDKLGQP